MTHPTTTLALPKVLLANVIILSLLLITSSQPAHAAVPNTINYQGFLADAAGVPIDATHNITFRIYTANSGGSPLYTSTQSITVVDGRFNTQLGDSPSFPANLFDGTPLFIGLEIDSDGEMTPRQALSSTPYAYKAEDADTVGGVSAASLDQSAHVSDTANPHSVTAAQVGAASNSDLTNHENDSSAHHAAYTNANAVSAMGALNNSNTLNHNRFTNSNAVSAMGAKSDANALNHDRYTLTDLLAVDGSGSNLDADLLDGMDSNAIIDAAADEVRTPISQSDLPLIISSPGSYYLTENLFHADVNTDAIHVNADHVSIELMGLTIAGPGKATGVDNSGVSISVQTGLKITNGTIRDFGAEGIVEIGSSGKSHEVIGVRVIGNGGNGIELLGKNHRVINCTALDNGQMNENYGIRVGSGSFLINNIAESNAADGISSGRDAILLNNIAYSNSGTGVFAGAGSVLTKNTASLNSGDGIFASQGATLTNNTASLNTGTGIRGSLGAVLTNNSARANAQWGINAAGGNLIKGNVISGNNTSNQPLGGGLRVGANSRSFGNLLDANSQQGIYVVGTGSILDSDHISSSAIGVNFIAPTENSNGYRNLSVSGFTSAAILGLPVSGTGNLIFNF